MRRRSRQIATALLGAALGATACSSRALAPPKLDLRSYRTIGLVEFVANVDPDRSRVATEEFLRAIHAAQPGARILELGTEARVLSEVQLAAWGPEAVRAVGRHHDVDAVLAGRMELSGIKPGVSLARFLTSVRLGADVEGTLSIRLYETDHGATLWTASAHQKEPVAEARLLSGVPSNLEAAGPEKAYGRLVESLVHAATGDLRASRVGGSPAR